jgi:iron complex outermembrane recepter protein
MHSLHVSLNSRAPFRRRASALAALAFGAPAAVAQQSAAATPSTTTVVITGNPLRNDIGAPASVLGGDALTRTRSGTLGDTLSGLPGVAATGFGPQSSRPVIRGLDGDRIRLLDNGGAAVDASSLSFDHAAAIDPLVVERFEVLRGPAALLYGGSATGGVVNAIDNRIPGTPLTGLGGRAELRFGGAARERAGAAVLEGGADGFNWHADVAARNSSDLRVPRFTPPNGEPARERVVNSAGDSQAGAVGASWADADGYVGAALDTYRNDYGVTVEPDVTIDMKRDRLQFSGERKLGGAIERIEWNAGHTRYKHQEIEGSGEVGTTFTSRGSELRAQAQHAPITLAGGALRGVFGMQLEKLDFSALGEEAFVPNTGTRSAALFALEEWKGPAFSVSGGVRAERVQVKSAGDAAGAEEPRFGSASQRRFSPVSASLGATLPLSKDFALTAQVGHTERAPTYYELYANGVHVATGAFEVGDATLGVERSAHAELGAQWTAGASLLKAQVFATRFSRYLALDATGNTFEDVNEEGEPVSLPEYAFRAVRARLVGMEVEGKTRLIYGAPWTLDAIGALDLVRGSNRTSGEPLARLPPLRARLGVEATHGAWTAGATVRHLAKQTRVPATDVPTPSATLLDVNLSWRQRWGAAEALWFARLDNLGDELAFNATALRNARELSPLAGRSATLGLRVAW